MPKSHLKPRKDFKRLTPLPVSALKFDRGSPDFTGMTAEHLGGAATDKDGFEGALALTLAATSGHGPAIAELDRFIASGSAALDALSQIDMDRTALDIEQALTDSGNLLDGFSAALDKLSLTPGLAFDPPPAVSAGAGGGGGGTPGVTPLTAFGTAVTKLLGPTAGGAILGGFAFGAALPLAVLAIMGINPFSDAPSEAQIETDVKTATPLVQHDLQRLAAWAQDPPKWLTVAFAQRMLATDLAFLHANHVDQYAPDYQLLWAEIVAKIQARG